MWASSLTPGVSSRRTEHAVHDPADDGAQQDRGVEGAGLDLGDARCKVTRALIRWTSGVFPAESLVSMSSTLGWTTVKWSVPCESPWRS